MRKGLEQTQSLWPAVRVAFAWVHRAARILKNEKGLSARDLVRRFRALLGALSRHQAKAGSLAPALAHFLKVTRSYWPGLFHCYRVADLPRTNNALEQLFGSSRYHERRTTGRKVSSPALVLRGSVRLIAATATRLRSRSATDLQPRDPARWQRLRQQLQDRQETRRRGLRFRRDPQAYVQQLEAELLKLVLPS